MCPAIQADAQVANWQWAKSGHGASHDQGNSIAIDASGNSYVAGYFCSLSITFGSTTLINSGNTGNFGDVFLVKYDPSGNVLWARSAGGSYNDEAMGLAIDASGNIYITGHFINQTITFGAFTLTNSGAIDLFIAKYDSNGNVLWAKSAAGATFDYAYSAAIDASGNCLITGYFDSPSITFGSFTLNQAGGGDLFLAKYDPSGNVLWAKSAGGSYRDVANSVCTDASGNSYITGDFQSATITFSSGTLNNTTNSGTYSDALTVKYDSSGNVLWAKSMGGVLNDYGNSISVDAMGNSYIAGDFQSGTIVFGTSTLTNMGSSDLFLAKYDGTGNTVWAKSSGGIYSDAANSVCTDASGNSFVTGSFASPAITFGSITLSNPFSTSACIFVTRYDAFGNSLWAKTEVKFTLDGDAGNAVSQDASGNMYVTGYYKSSHIIIGSDTLINTNSFKRGEVFIASLSILEGMNSLDSSDNSISVFPNPSSGTFSVSNKFTSEFDIEIFNSLGQAVFYRKNVNESRFEIDLLDQADGIYFVRIISKGEVYTGKIVKE